MTDISQDSNIFKNSEVLQYPTSKSKTRVKPEQLSLHQQQSHNISAVDFIKDSESAQDGGNLNETQNTRENQNQVPQNQDLTNEIARKEMEKSSTASSHSQRFNKQNNGDSNSRPGNSTKDNIISQQNGSNSPGKENEEMKQKQSQKENQGKNSKFELSNDASQSTIKKVENKDYCQKCKDGGDLLCCDYCPRSFHVKCLGVNEDEIPEGEWFCEKCKPRIEKKRAIEEERRKKAQEREHQILEKRIKQEQLKREKEKEQEKKREEKRLQKQKLEEEKRIQKQKEIEELKKKLLNNEPNQNGGQAVNLQENKIENPVVVNQDDEHQKSQIQDQSKEKEKIKKYKQLPLQVSKQEQEDKQAADQVIQANQKRAEERQEAEKVKDSKAQQLKLMLKIFAKHYPELVDKNQIKYPIEDNLIQKMPQLHGAENQPAKPEPKKILIEGQQFENLMYIWEFFNNFTDFLDCKEFKIEELQAALNYNQSKEDAKLYDATEEEMSWEQKVTLQSLKDQGFGLINSMHLSLLQCFLEEIKSSDKQKQVEFGEDEEKDELLIAIKQNIEKPQRVWPELIRLILVQKTKYDKGCENEMSKICDKLSKCTPETYNSILTYEEKIELLSFLIDCIHDLNEFRQFLNQRLEEKSQYNKQKMDIYAEIKQLENKKQDLIKDHAQSNYINNSEQILNEIDTLKAKLATATRTEAKRIKEQINELQYEKNRVLKEMEKFEDQIEKKQSKIERLNEQAFKTTIKTQALGKDIHRNEYWFFKEEPQKVFVKKLFKAQQADQEEMEVDEANIDMEVYQEPQFKWFYYDEEEELEKLLQACNTKGIRERKLQENLRKISERMKLKKTRKPKEQNKDDNKIEQEDQSEQLQQYSQDQNEKEWHHLFENDYWRQSLHNAIWYQRKMPPKKAAINQRKDSNTISEVSLENIKDIILNVENIYSDTSLQFSREWETKEKRDMIIEGIRNAQTVEDISKLLLQMDSGFCHPHALRYKDTTSEKQSPVQSDEDMSESGEDDGDQTNNDQDNKSPEEQKDDYQNVKRFKLKLFKYWSSKELKESWRSYVFKDCIYGNVNALYIAVKLLEKINNVFVQRQFNNLEKKQKKEERKYKQTDQQTSRGTKQTYNRQDKPNYKQFFESESDDEDMTAKNERSAKGGIKTRGTRGRKKMVDSDSEMEIDEEEEDEQEEQKEWDDDCYICGKEGEVMCCETCSHVSHYECLGLKKPPSGDWYCEACLKKQTQRRTTRQQTHQQQYRATRSQRNK